MQWLAIIYIVITAADILSFPSFQLRIKVGSVPVFRHRLHDYIVFTFDCSRRFLMASLFLLLNDTLKTRRLRS